MAKWKQRYQIIIINIKGSAGFVRHVTASEEKSKILVVTEGPETGASLIPLFPESNIIASLSVGNYISCFDVIKSCRPKMIILAGDHDINPIPRGLTFEAARFYRDNGFKVHLIIPELINERSTDWNDVLVHRGIEDIWRQFNRVLSNQKSNHTYCT